jgi:hypothetical protein
MGIPIFCIRPELIITESGVLSEETRMWQGKRRLDRGEVRDLERRVLEVCEDLFGDEDDDEGVEKVEKGKGNG